jgi:hypothetical protein
VLVSFAKEERVTMKRRRSWRAVRKMVQTNRRMAWRQWRCRLVLENLADRVLPSISSQGLPAWIEQGPGPITGGEVQGIPPNNPVAGGVQAIAAHPTNADIVYVATVNGGIWKTTNATAASPTWTPLTDLYPSLSFGTIALSPVNTNVVYAGTARVSAGGRDGGPLNGLLRTIDGGTTWSMIGVTTFNGQNISKVQPTSLSSGAVVLVASGNGVYRSTDSGDDWTLLSGTGGLPTGEATDLVADPANANRFYAAVPGSAQRVFRSDDGGVHWNQVVANLPATGWRVKLSVGAGGVIYAATVSSQLTNVYRSTTAGASWASMGVPSPTINPGNQGSIHFSMLADRTDSTVVFVGGDTQDGSGFNGCGRASVTGNHSRGVAPGTWTMADCNGASLGGSPTSGHADSRGMVFDAHGDILEADDGGIYRLVNPNGAANARRWVSVLGNLRPTEFYSVAYDRYNHTVIGGAQDVGASEQVSGFTWRATRLADGGVAAVDNNTLVLLNQSIHYQSIQGLGAFGRRVLDNQNREISAQLIALNLTGTTPTRNLFQVEANNPGGSTVQFIQPYVLNRVDPRRMLIGTSFLYESAAQDMGDTLAATGGLINLGGGNYRPANPVGQVTAMVYGGFIAGSPNTQVMYVGAGGQLWIRTSGGGMPAVSTTYPGSGVRAVQTDYTDWRIAYVLDSLGRVWRTTDAGATAGNWTNVTGNLASLATDLRTIEVVHSGSNVAVLVGGLGGVYRAINPGGTATWSRYGTALSNAIVTDLHFSIDDNTLYAGTFGRGAWRVANAYDSLFQAPVLTVNGTAGNDTITLALDPNIPGLLNIFLNSATPVFSVPAVSLQQIIINGLGGNDVINIEDTIAGVPVSVDGGDGNDTVNISPVARNLSHIQANVTANGGAGLDAINIYDQAYAGSGTYTLGSGPNLSRTGLATIAFNGFNNGATINGGSGHNTYNVLSTTSWTTTLNGGNAGDVYNIEATVGALTVNAGNGNDTVNVSPTAHNLDNIHANVTVNAGFGSDAITINDQAFASATTYTLGSGPNLSRTGSAVIAFNGFNNGAIINGGRGNNTYNVLSTTSWTTTLNSGPGRDVINIEATIGDLAVNTGDGNNTVNISPSARNLDNIHGAVVANGAPLGQNRLFITDEYNPVATTYTLGGTSSSPTLSRPGAGLITYTGFNDGIVIVGGSSSSGTYLVLTTSLFSRGTILSTGLQQNTVSVEGTVGPLEIDAHGGGDIINVGDSANTLNGIQGPLVVDDILGQTPTLNLIDSGESVGQYYYLTSTTLDRYTAATITYLRVQAVNLYGGSGDDYLQIGDAGAAVVSFDGGGGNNYLQGPEANTVWAITGADTGYLYGDAIGNYVAFTGVGTLLGGSASDTFYVGDGASLSGYLDGGGGDNTVVGPDVANTWSVWGYDAGNLNYAVNFYSVQYLVGGADADTFYIGDGAGLSGYIDGGGGSNTLDLSAYSTDLTFTITAANAGTVDGVLSFFAVQNLTGGGANNTFVFNDGTGLDGTILGGGGTNTLDYSAYSTSVVVDLQTEYATGVGGGVSNIQNVTGGNGGDPGTYNLLIGNGGNVLTGGTGRRNVLVAGRSASTLNAGDGEDLLIGGFTIYDGEADLASWLQIADYWAGTDDFFTRVANLTTPGSGVPLLDASTITGNGGGNTMTGNGGLALIYSDGQDNISGFDPNAPIIPIAP